MKRLTKKLFDLFSFVFKGKPASFAAFSLIHGLLILLVSAGSFLKGAIIANIDAMLGHYSDNAFCIVGIDEDDDRVLEIPAIKKLLTDGTTYSVVESTEVFVNPVGEAGGTSEVCFVDDPKDLKKLWNIDIDRIGDGLIIGTEVDENWGKDDIGGAAEICEGDSFSFFKTVLMTLPVDGMYSISDVVPAFLARPEPLFHADKIIASTALLPRFKALENAKWKKHYVFHCQNEISLAMAGGLDSLFKDEHGESKFRSKVSIANNLVPKMEATLFHYFDVTTIMLIVFSAVAEIQLIIYHASTKKSELATRYFAGMGKASSSVYVTASVIISILIGLSLLFALQGLVFSLVLYPYLRGRLLFNVISNGFTLEHIYLIIAAAMALLVPFLYCPTLLKPSNIVE